jgi:hypothetical protein
MEVSYHSTTPSDLADLRRVFHRELCRDVLSVRAQHSAMGTKTPVYSNADGYSETSVDFAARMAERLPIAEAPKAHGTAAGRAFERSVLNFIERAIPMLPDFAIKRMQVAPGRVISNFAQFAHLAEIQAVVRKNPELEATLGGDYLVNPDLVVFWGPLDDDNLRPAITPTAEQAPTLSPVRSLTPGAGLPILHASISCKWTIRSDRVQNTRTEALNLVRNRKGRTPHIVAVTMEPEPKRLAAIAIGTGDIDCVYHGALYELREAALEAEEIAPSRAGARRRLEMMIQSNRLRDISDLPLDLLA